MPYDYKNMPDEKEDQVPYFCRFTFGQFFALLVLEVITLAFVFYLGAKYGNEYLRIAKEEEEGPMPMVVGTPLGGPVDETIQQMARDVVAPDESRELKEKVQELMGREGASAATQAQASAQTPGQPPATAPTQAAPPDLRPVGPEVPQVAAPTAPQVAATEPIKVKGPSSAVFSIQVGSYPNINEASAKIEEWKTKGYPAFMMIADIPDRGRWYRVRFGGFSTKEDAERYLEALRTNENDAEDAIIVPNE